MGARNGWNLAYWFAGLNSFLDEECPQNLLARQLEQLIAFAKNAMKERSCLLQFGNLPNDS